MGEDQDLENKTHVKLYKIIDSLSSINETMSDKVEEFTKKIPIDQYKQISSINDWMIDEDLDEDAMFVDLQNNPERYTGYNGSNIWQQVYASNINNIKFSTKGPHESFLYKIISGIHVNINMHIAQFYLYDVETDELTIDEYKPNYEIFYERIGKYPERVHNLFYTYIYLLHTINKLGPALSNYTYSFESKMKSEIIQNKMKWLVHYIHMLEGVDRIKSDLYNNINKNELVEIIKPVFKNITELMD